jgi:hypothetical protein
VLGDVAVEVGWGPHGRPIMAGLWVWQRPWAVAIRLMVLLAIAVWNVFLFFPRSERSKGDSDAGPREHAPPGMSWRFAGLTRAQSELVNVLFPANGAETINTRPVTAQERVLAAARTPQRRPNGSVARANGRVEPAVVTPMVLRSTTAKIITAVSVVVIASTLLILLLWLLGSPGEGSESALTAL